jgi:RHS repeat-associated protein
MITTLVGMEFRRSDICERLFHRSELETHSCMRTNRASASTLRCQFSISVAGASSASALIKKLSLPNSSYITNTFDSVSRVLTTKLNNSSHSTLNSHAYVYNPGHQRTKQTRTDGSYVDYTYDTVSELQSGKGYTSGGSPISTEQMGYKYDPGWNLNQRTNNGSVQTFTVDNQNQLTSDGVNSYSYDSNGNLISKSWSSPSYGSLTYTYDDENQLASVATDTSYTPDYARWKVEFVYDGRMRRRVKKEYTWNSGYGAWQLNSETRYVYDGNLVIQERNSSNTPTVQYTRGTDLSGSFEGAGGIGGMLSRSTGYSSGTGNWSTHHHYHADGNGNITAMVDSGQSLSASYKYDPYGKLLTSSGTQAGANLYRFSSKEFHVNSGLYYYGYRFYDPNLQDGGINLYAFVENSPIDWIDDFGDQARPTMPGRPGPGMPGGPRNRGGRSHRYPNAPPIQPRPHAPKNLWPGGRQPSMCITIPVMGRNMQRAGRAADKLAEHLLGDPSVPSSGSYVNAPPDIGLSTPATPPNIIFLPRGSGPVIVAPGTIIIWY